ncbi:GH92 family glycosyl hydrolase [Fundicoccus culcitae]|uniref:GH92 family glycosyl hydrolase n=1 Tax=Fundicoccus culcitae TaxID=2969821 RepID=A0ABY5P938_9LACT|nr:GH92 family glycosyl hydrolase [Fundicoccus culcitae]UUX35272.1 GH92 family glycosyl hydrolase [Fundicoccus culcitae]
MDINKVDTRHGTFNREELSNGNTLPYTGVPFGMNYFAVQNQNDSNWFFDPTLPLFQGIRLTHQPSPWMGDYCKVLFSPITKEPKVSDLEINQSSYDIDDAIFKPHFMSMFLYRYRLRFSLVPSKRGAKFNLTNYSDDELGLIIQTENGAEVICDEFDNKLFIKLTHTVNKDKSILNFFLALDFGDINFDVFQFNSENKLSDSLSKGLTTTCKSLYIKFDTKMKDIEFSLGTSFISQELAIRNLETEVLNKNSDQLINDNESEWNELLNKIQVYDNNNQKVDDFNYYLYRIFLFPQTFYEIDKNESPIHFDIYNQIVKKGKYFTNIGFWDAYRTTFPLYSIILPDLYRDVLEGIQNFYESTTHLPKWLSPDERGLMPGTHVSAVIADAAVKGLIDEEQIKFFMNALIKEAEIESEDIHFGRRGVSDTKKYGYVSINEEGSVNQTLDNSYSDFSISQLAKLIGDKETQMLYREKSLNYRNLFDKDSGFFRGKDENGNFIEPFSPDDWSREYVEASPWVSSLAVFHNFADLITLFEGKDNFKNHLLDLANSEPTYTLSKDGKEYNEISELAINGFGQIGISNQPGFHLPYLYVYVGKPEYTQLIVRQICEQLFSSSIDGYPGDEDNGSLSGWYIFSTIGFYPVTPGTNQYVIGIPQFDKICLNLPNGNVFTIRTTNHKVQNQFIKNMKLNGEDYSRLYLTHDTILNGGDFHVDLSLLPNEKDYSENQLPYSLNTDNNGID